MRDPKVGDKIVVTKFDGEVIKPVIREIVDINAEHAIMLMDKPLGDGNRGIEHPDWIWNDNWRFAVRKGDRLVVTKMCGKSVEPTIVEAEEDEDEAGGLIYLSEDINIPDRHDHNVLSLGNQVKDIYGSGEDKWYFAEDYVAEHGIPSSYISEQFGIEDTPIADICSSFNECEPEYYVEKDSFGQSYSEFNAAHGGGKTLKDYTGVDITPETLGFVSDRDKTIQGITAESLAFEESVDNVNHPSHYNATDMEVIDKLEDLASKYDDPVEAYLVATASKYLERAAFKGKKKEDWEKSKWYLERAIERAETNE